MDRSLAKARCNGRKMMRVERRMQCEGSAGRNKYMGGKVRGEKSEG